MSTPSDTPTTDGGAKSARTTHTTGSRRAFGHAWLVARTELRRRRRALGENTRQIVGYGIVGLMGLVFTLALVAGAYFFGISAGTGAFADRLTVARGLVSGVWGYAVFFTALRTLQGQNSLEAPAAVLTAVPSSEVAVGLLLSEYVVIAGVAALPIVAIAVAFAVGAVSPASVIVGPVVLFAVLAFGVVCGYVVGLVVKNLVARYAVVARFKTVLGVLVFLLYLAVIWSDTGNAIVGPVFAFAEATPLGWFADLALVASPDVAIGLARPAEAAATLVVGTALVTGLTARLAGTLWYTDPVQPGRGGGGSTGAGTTTAAVGRAESGAPGTNRASETAAATNETLSTGFSDRLFGGRVPRSALRIAQKSWRRAYRAPRKLQYVVFPLFFLIDPIQQSIQSGTVSTVLPASVAIYGAWATGAAFTLNPLGDEGAVLPVTLTTPISGTRILSGLVLAGVAVGAPLTGVLAVVLGVLSPLGVLSAVALGVLGVILCVGACAVGVGVGTAFPKFERTRISRSREAIVPSLSAFVVYSLSLFAVSLPGLLAGVPLVADSAGTALGVPDSMVTFGGVVLTVLLATVAGWIATRSAGETIDEYTM